MITGSALGGGEISLGYHLVGIVREGRVTNVENFPIDDLSGALLRWDELTSGLPGLMDNAASRLVARWATAIRAGDLEALVAQVAPDALAVDRRRGLGDATQGVPAMRDLLVGVLEVTTGVAPRLLAVRGDRLVLYRCLFHGPDGFEVEVLSINEVDADGRITYAVTFDSDALDAAIDELDARAFAGPGEAELTALAQALVSAANAAVTSTVRLVPARYHALTPIGALVTWLEETETGSVGADRLSHSVVRFHHGGVVDQEAFPGDDLAQARRRYDELSGRAANTCTALIARLPEMFARRVLAKLGAEAFFAPEFVRQDRRRGMVGEVDRFGILTSLRVIADAGVDHVAVTDVATRGDRLAVVKLHFATSDDREIDIAALFESDADERICAAVYFDHDAVDAAVSELEARWRASRPGGVLENAASVAASEFGRLFNASDWAGVRAMLADDFASDHLRPVLRSHNDPDGFIASIRAAAELGMSDFSATPIATRGERLALVQVEFTSEDDFRGDLLTVTETDECGRLVALVHFEPDDRDGADEELDRRWLASLDEPSAARAQGLVDYCRAYNRRDWAHVNETYRGGTMVDRRPASFGTGALGERSGRDFQGMFVELVPDARIRILAVIAVRADGGVALVRVEGTAEGGGSVEVEFVMCASGTGDAFTLELWSADEIPGALARFAEMDPALSGGLQGSHTQDATNA